MPLALEFSRQPSRFMRKMKRVNNTDGNRIWARIGLLTHTPKPSQAARVAGYTAEVYRVRVGDYRIIYAFDDKTLHIHTIERRDKAYQQFHINFTQSGAQP